jgi:hypothetical protein
MNFFFQKGCTRLAATSDKVYQLLAHGRWFSPGTPAYSTTKTGSNDIAEILLKVALNLNTINQSLKEYLFTIKRGTNYNKADNHVICISRVIYPCFDIVHRNRNHSPLLLFGDL